MVRRRRNASEKKERSGPRPVDKKDARVKRWNKASDIPMDEEDQFHASRDKILLGGDDYADDDDGDEEEVFALKGMPASTDDEDEDEEGDEEDDEDAMDVDEDAPPAKRPSKGKAKATSQPQDASDASDAESEEEETWGRKKSAYYSSNAAELESDDEEANELEEQEAKRLQAKMRAGMVEDDFGLGDVVEVDAQEDEEAIHDLLEPAPKVVTRAVPLDKKAAIRHLETTSPETLALAYDWDETAWKIVRAQEKLKQLSADAPESLSLGMVHLHYQALLTYATTLAFYLHLRAGERYAQKPELLRTHPIYTRLLELKQALNTLEELEFDLSDSDIEGMNGTDDEDDEDLSLDDEDSSDIIGRILQSGRKSSRMELEDLAELLREAQEPVPSVPTKSALKKNKKPADIQPDEPPKKKRKTDKASAAPVFTFDLVEPEFVPTKKSAPTPVAVSADVYGDATALGAADAADKSARKRTLRFHTAKIESASARRQHARAALGGDDDVPYRERRKEKEERMKREAQARGRGGDGADLDDEEPEARRPSKADMGEVEGEGDEEGSGEEDADGYYSLVKKQKSASKEAKKADYEAAKAAARPDFNDADDANGPRSLTRAILKNRGLTPSRSKSVRNPRVKKRQKFDKAKKRVASQKAVYKGGIGDANKYQGEASGISKVVKSVQF
ncbi:hypothetical protein FA95DRAFT_1682542 [Auriscalpium vulgare]|uniref:Uncharacterized protein n=1 Tax=Auriscalpium vulgare TaxID=40419 RepID=A0ACB8RFM5_9AGAM|nr:hypothetical protein FA95DRAFT_1682542 [Auriscalpium vulgare]